MKPNPISILAAALLFSLPAIESHAARFRHITAEAASVNTHGDITEGGITYAVIYKPDPPGAWVRAPWLSPSQAFRGSRSVGMEISPQADAAGANNTDKVNTRLVVGNASFAPGFGDKKYLGFAVKLASDFGTPVENLLIAQWWQGSPYTPPLCVAIVPNSNPLRYELHGKSNDTGGNPSAPPIVIPGGTLPTDVWQTFVIMTIFDHSGTNGQVKVWQNGTLVTSWTGKIGYNPNTIPYPNPPAGTPTPNTKMEVYFGPYRNRQLALHKMFFDEIKFSDTYAEAVP